jgi:hypothetical protein
MKTKVIKSNLSEKEAAVLNLLIDINNTAYKNLSVQEKYNIEEVTRKKQFKESFLLNDKIQFTLFYGAFVNGIFIPSDIEILNEKLKKESDFRNNYILFYSIDAIFNLLNNQMEYDWDVKPLENIIRATGNDILKDYRNSLNILEIILD